MDFDGVSRVLVVGAALVGVAGAWLAAAGSGVRGLLRNRRTERRIRRADGAALDAALDDAAFAPETVRADADALLVLAERAWAGAPPIDDARWTPELAAWADARGPADPRASRLGRRRIELLQVVNRAGHAEDRVVVGVRWQPRGRAGFLDRSDERWVLGLRDGAWVLLAAHGSTR